MKEKDFYWLIGLLEGEGCFMKGSPSSPNKPRIQLQMTDEDVVARVSVLFNRKYQFIKSRNVKHKDSYVVSLSGKRAVDLMQKVQSEMSLRRQEQIQKAIDSYDVNFKHRNHNNRNKLSDEIVKNNLPRLKTESLRSIARDLNVHPQSLKRRFEQTEEY